MHTENPWPNKLSLPLAYRNASYTQKTRFFHNPQSLAHLHKHRSPLGLSFFDARRDNAHWEKYCNKNYYNSRKNYYVTL